ncbi:MAG: hypothetical protein RL722_1190 [Pseudomonadota bacterium]|jgi:hypothetical protein
MYLMAQLWFYLLMAALLGVLVGATSRRLHRAINLQHTLEAVEFRHTEQMAGMSAEHEAALMALDQLRKDLDHAQKHGSAPVDLAQRIELREQQLRELGNQLRRVNQELVKNQVNQQQAALERKQTAAEIDTLRVQVAASRARLAQAVSNHEEEKAALVRQLVALMPAAGQKAASSAAGGTFGAAASLAGASLASVVKPALPVEPPVLSQVAASAAPAGADQADAIAPAVEPGPSASALEDEAAAPADAASAPAAAGTAGVIAAPAARSENLQDAMQAGIAAAMASLAAPSAAAADAGALRSDAAEPDALTSRAAA